MAPLPFPFPMRLGTDICSIKRIEKLLSGRQSARFVRRILRHEECIRSPVSHILDTDTTQYARPDADPLVISQRAATFMAGRFAAKEAVMKAHSRWDLGFHDIEIRKQEAGNPVAIVWPGGQGEGGRMAQEALVSISHDGEYATAVCIGYDHSQGGDDAGGR